MDPPIVDTKDKDVDMEDVRFGDSDRKDNRGQGVFLSLVVKDSLCLHSVPPPLIEAAQPGHHSFIPPTSQSHNDQPPVHYPYSHLYDGRNPGYHRDSAREFGRVHSMDSNRGGMGGPIDGASYGPSMSFPYTSPTLACTDDSTTTQTPTPITDTILSADP